MHFHVIAGRPSTTLRPGVSWLLPGFAVLSLTAHALLFIPGEEDEQPDIVYPGTPYIRVTLAIKPQTSETLAASHAEQILRKVPTPTPVAARQAASPVSTSAPAPMLAKNTQKPIATIRTHAVLSKTTAQTTPPREAQPAPDATRSESTAFTADNTEKYPVTKTAALDTNIETREKEDNARKHELMRNYLLGELRNQLSRYLTYPQRARRRGWEGEVLLALDISTQGRLRNIQLVHSSGYAPLDRSAMKSLSRIDKLRLPASSRLRETINLQLPVVYRLSRN